MLVVEPLRWALALRPEWVALEQVPEVLPLWEVMASLLQAHGYSTWTGKLEAERFGVPQTRERAILIAHRSRAVVPPEPTHQRYVPGEPQRHEVTMFGEVLPWVSMAEALGWGTGGVVQHRRSGDRIEEEWSADRPSDTVSSRVDRWGWERPSTTVNGDPRISKPGRHDPEESGSQQEARHAA
jgi:DNA (cytosine-5)-methyltransferase 1